jgi:hypothetical protein
VIYDVDSGDLFGCGETHAGIVLKLAVLSTITVTLQVPIPQICDFFRDVYTCSRSYVGEEEGTLVA